MHECRFVVERREISLGVFDGKPLQLNLLDKLAGIILRAPSRFGTDKIVTSHDALPQALQTTSTKRHSMWEDDRSVEEYKIKPAAHQSHVL